MGTKTQHPISLDLIIWFHFRIFWQIMGIFHLPFFNHQPFGLKVYVTGGKRFHVFSVTGSSQVRFGFRLQGGWLWLLKLGAGNVSC